MHARLIIRVEVYELLLGRDDVLAPWLPRLEALGQPREVRAQALAAVAGEAARDVLGHPGDDEAFARADVRVPPGRMQHALREHLRL